jgi:hypothetical protein
MNIAVTKRATERALGEERGMLFYINSIFYIIYALSEIHRDELDINQTENHFSPYPRSQGNINLYTVGSKSYSNDRGGRKLRSNFPTERE